MVSIFAPIWGVAAVFGDWDVCCVAEDFPRQGFQGNGEVFLVQY